MFKEANKINLFERRGSDFKGALSGVGPFLGTEILLKI